jgi:hypothetical protein
LTWAGAYPSLRGIMGNNRIKVEKINRRILHQDIELSSKENNMSVVHRKTAISDRNDPG